MSSSTGESKMKKHLFYQHDHDTNLDEMFKVYEVPFIIRKIILLVKPNIEVVWDEEIDEFDIVVQFFYFTYNSKFKLDEEVEEKIPFTGEIVKKIVTKREDGRYLATQLTGRHAGAQYITEFTEDVLIVQMMYRDVTAVRRWKKKV